MDGAKQPLFNDPNDSISTLTHAVCHPSTMPSLVMVGVNRVEDDDIELSEMLAMEQPRELGPGGESAFGSDLGNRFVYSTLMAFAGMEPFHIEPETGRRILSAFAHCT